MKQKSEVFTHFQTFVAMDKNLFNASIKYFQSDGGSEYVNHSFQDFLHHLGIQHRLSYPQTPQQNGLDERKHRYIADMTRTLLAAAHAPLTLCVEAALTSIHLINLLHTSTLNWFTPHTLLFGRLLPLTSLWMYVFSIPPELCSRQTNASFY